MKLQIAVSDIVDRLATITEANGYPFDATVFHARMNWEGVELCQGPVFSAYFSNEAPNSTDPCLRKFDATVVVEGHALTDDRGQYSLQMLHAIKSAVFPDQKPGGPIRALTYKSGSVLYTDDADNRVHVAVEIGVEYIEPFKAPQPETK